MAVTPDGRRALSASWDNTLRIWDLESGESLRTLEGHTDSVNAVAVTSDGRRAVSASWDNTLRIWDLESGESLRTLEGHTDWVNAVAVTSDGRRAVSASGDNTLRIWDLESGESLRTLEGHTDEVNAVAVTSDGRRALSASYDKTLRIWDLESGESLRTLEGHTGWVTAVAVTSDGRRAVSASGDNTLRIWDLESGESLRTLEGHTDLVTAVAVTSDGRRALSASGDKTLRIWDLESGESLRTLEGHTGWVTAVAVTSDGRRAVSASGDKTLRIWDLESGKAIATFIADAVLGTCAITPDGLTFVAGDESGQLHFLRLIEPDKTTRPASATKTLIFRRKDQFRTIPAATRNPKEPPMAEPNIPRPVFVSYAHKDNESSDPSKRWLDRLTEFLEPLVQQDELTICSDEGIGLGDDWHAHIQKHLNGARAAVLLVSPAFLASKYVRSSELPILLRNAKEKNVKIIPIILRPCLFAETKFKYPDPKIGPEAFTLASLQAAGSPGKALSEMTEAEQDRTLLKVAQALIKLVSPNPS